MSASLAKSGSIYDTLFVSQMKKNVHANTTRPLTVAFNLYDASQKKSGPLRTDNLPDIKQQFDSARDR